MEHPLKGRWGNRDQRDVLYQISFDFVAQLEDIMESEGIGRTELAAKLGVSKGRVSQILNNPGNLTLKNVVQYTRALHRKVTIVTYDDTDAGHERGPIQPQIFATCWEKAGKPSDIFSASAIVVISSETEVDPRWNWAESARGPSPDWKSIEVAETAGYLDSEEYQDDRYKPSLKDLTHART